ncbi:hypothetical protein WA026_020092 [Henosepilachna vigintioctopunctata]|uniref:Uncharacterized protein n=1 Tax=Henosepilachna vigintioctopunctata TaxID=420089 RepID=A0AAW1U4K0_9CUCU
MSDVESKGTKPTSEATSILEIFSFMVLFLCKKILFVDRKLRIIYYLGCLFLISLIKDAITIPKWYFSRSDNILNTFFVKFAWGWNLALIVPFLLLTSYIYCCGQKNRILKYHIPRVFIATFFWWFWIKIFNIVEASFGRCMVKAFVSKDTCLLAGYVWNGFDISGHSFILIYGSLVLIEEANCMMQWDSIKDYLRLEEHNKKIIKDSTLNNNPLRNLSDEEFVNLQKIMQNILHILGYFL